MKFLIIIFLCGCVSEPLTEDQQFDKAYEQQEKIIEIHAFIQRCEEAGNNITYIGPSVIRGIHKGSKARGWCITKRDVMADFYCLVKG